MSTIQPLNLAKVADLPADLAEFVTKNASSTASVHVALGKEVGDVEVTRRDVDLACGFGASGLTNESHRDEIEAYNKLQKYMDARSIDAVVVKADQLHIDTDAVKELAAEIRALLAARAGRKEQPKGA